ncbi:MAG: hypothetical protein NXI09_01540 [Bacteroidetes bacterium]|nr:hypothetical protein [Bacteroidota bacterium]
MKKYIVFSILLLSSAFINAQVVYVSTDSLRVAGSNPDLAGGLPVSVPSDSVGTRLVFWIHGIAGNLNSWGRVQFVTQDQSNRNIPGYPERNVIGYNADYSSYEDVNPIFDVAGRLNEDMEIWRVALPRTDTLPVSSNFAVVHSQGGIVARAIRWKNNDDPFLYPTQFSHIASFGSPHTGAFIINSSSDTGAMLPWLNEGCTVLSSAEIKTFVNTKWYGSFIPTSVVSSLSLAACDGLSKTVIPLIVSSIRKTSSLDYAQGAPKLLDTLAPFALQDTLNTKAVNFYGVEEEPVFWRVVNTMTFTEDSNLGAPIIRNNPFGLNNDQELPDLVNNKIYDYQGKERQNAMLARVSKPRYPGIYPFGLFNIIQSLLSSEYTKTAKIYREAYRWLGHANMNWKRFIGARRDTAWIDGYYCHCATFTPNGLQIHDTVVQNPSDCGLLYPGANCQVGPRLRHQIIEEPNDGVVPVSSQTGMPGARVSELMIMENTNHMQERNSEQTKEKLNSLFDGAHGKEFQLDKK